MKHSHQFKLLAVAVLLSSAAPALDAQCYVFSSGTAASLTVNITHLPTPDNSTVSWIYQYTSSNGLVAAASLKIGSVVYSATSAPISVVTVGNDTSTGFSSIDFNSGFSAGSNISVGVDASVDWSKGSYFPGGKLPVSLPSIATAFSSSLVAIVTGPSGTIVDQTYPLTSVTSCGTAQPTGTPSLTVVSQNFGNFLAGQPVAVYSLQVQNVGTAASSGSVYVADSLPSGISPNSIAGNGWTCAVLSLSCYRSDPLPAGGTYPAIVVSANVSPFASSPVINRVVVSGGGSDTNITSNSTSILPAFTDVLPSDPFLSSIDLLKGYGITSACQDQPLKFCANDAISEAQMAVFIIRALVGGDNFSYSRTPYFTDVASTNLYFPWVQSMQDRGIGVPCLPNQYCPDMPVTRSIMSVLIIRAKYGTSEPASYPTVPYFTDVPASHPYFPWIQKMREQGITTGCTPTAYCPDQAVTRGQMAVFIMRGLFGYVL